MPNVKNLSASDTFENAARSK